MKLLVLLVTLVAALSLTRSKALLVALAGWAGGLVITWVAGLLAFFAVLGTLQDLEGFAGRSLIYLAAAYAFWKLWYSTREREQSPRTA